MKKLKSTYLLLGLPLLFSACSGEADLPFIADRHGGETIIFRTSLPGISTRAHIFTEDSLKYLHVTAFNPDLSEHFLNKRVDLTGGVGESDECFWPKVGRESDVLTFFAYYPGLKTIDEVAKAFIENKSDTAKLTNNTILSGGTPVFDLKMEHFHVAPDIADQIDFLAADTTGNMNDNLFSGITLPFRHQLSRIEIKACGAHKSCNIEIAGVRIGGIGVEDTFNFNATEGAGGWSGNPAKKGVVEYIYRNGDKIVSLPKRQESTSTADGAVSIMGNAQPDGNNAMLIPADYSTEWNRTKGNANMGMYISVLLRIEDATLTAGTNPVEVQRYPYKDLSQGKDALKIPRIYFAIEKETDKIHTRLYKNENKYFVDSGCSDPYIMPEDKEIVIKDFGWAALPATGNWAPGNIYTYTLDYSSGIGLHDPEVDTKSPGAGDPIISDKVGFSYTVKKWNDGGSAEFLVPVPGS